MAHPPVARSVTLCGSLALIATLCGLCFGRPGIDHVGSGQVQRVCGAESRAWILVMLMVMSIGMSAAYLYADDTDLFMLKVPPDVLIILDLSGSMNWVPAGTTLYIGSDDGDDSNDNLVSCGIDGPFYAKSGPGHTKPCYNLAQIDGPIYGDSGCNGPFYKTSGAGHTTNCSRLAIAKRAIFDILDDTDDGKIDAKDETSLAVRFGYMSFYGCGNDSGTSYIGGCNQLIKTFNTAYNQINTAVQGEGKIIRVITNVGTVVNTMYLIWVNKSVPAIAGARFVVSDNGDILSPK